MRITKLQVLEGWSVTSSESGYHNWLRSRQKRTVPTNDHYVLQSI
jgi:hypothetical protein